MGLVLSRKTDEVIRIGDDITIKVVGFRGDKVRLDINAPPHIPVHREEVWKAIHQEDIDKCDTEKVDPRLI